MPADNDPQLAGVVVNKGRLSIVAALFEKAIFGRKSFESRVSSDCLLSKFIKQDTEMEGKIRTSVHLRPFGVFLLCLRCVLSVHLSKRFAFSYRRQVAEGLIITTMEVLVLVEGGVGRGESFMC